MRAMDELCRLNPRLRPLLMEAELDAESQLAILKENASVFGSWVDPEALNRGAVEVERAIRNYLKQYPPLTRRPRRGTV